jgi:HSP20 family protein
MTYGIEKRGRFLHPLERQVSRLFGDFFGDFPLKTFDFTPSLDVVENDDNIVIKTEIPGVDPNELEITLKDDLLVIKGEKKKETEEDNGSFYHSERVYGSFMRSVALPASIQIEKVSAAAKDGIVTITLPKKAEEKAKSIKVKS